MSEKQTGSAWATSLNGEIYDYPFYASREEAIANGTAEYNGDPFWIGKTFPL